MSIWCERRGDRSQEADFNLYFISVTDEWILVPVGLYVEVLGCSCLWQWCWWHSIWWSPFSPLCLHFEGSFLDATPQRRSGHAKDKREAGELNMGWVWVNDLMLIYYSYMFSLQDFMTTKMSKLQTISSKFIFKMSELKVSNCALYFFYFAS